jgi:hypothetical protein
MLGVASMREVLVLTVQHLMKAASEPYKSKMLARLRRSRAAQVGPGLLLVAPLGAEFRGKKH